uniref:Plasmalemma vesicle associated protein n=1 Tax=Anas platyrhynchos platyrhynchos TaxID=8840 RepID=A0A493TR62_ANAPP
MEKSGYTMAKFGLETKEAMPRRDCGFYMKYVFLFTSLIQFLIILGLVLFMVYGNAHAGTDTHLRLLEEQLQDRYNKIITLGGRNANLTRALNTTLKEKQGLQGALQKVQRELDKCNSSQLPNATPKMQEMMKAIFIQKVMLDDYRLTVNLINANCSGKGAPTPTHHPPPPPQPSGDPQHPQGTPRAPPEAHLSPLGLGRDTTPRCHMGWERARAGRGAHTMHPNPLPPLTPCSREGSAAEPAGPDGPGEEGAGEQLRQGERGAGQNQAGARGLPAGAAQNQDRAHGHQIPAGAAEARVQPPALRVQHPPAAHQGNHQPLQLRLHARGAAAAGAARRGFLPPAEEPRGRVPGEGCLRAEPAAVPIQRHPAEAGAGEAAAGGRQAAEGRPGGEEEAAGGEGAAQQGAGGEEQSRPAKQLPEAAAQHLRGRQGEGAAGARGQPPGVFHGRLGRARGWAHAAFVGTGTFAQALSSLAFLPLRFRTRTFARALLHGHFSMCLFSALRFLP